MKKKRSLALLGALALSGSSVPISVPYSYSYAAQQIVVTVDSDFIDSIVVNAKTYDGDTDATVDLSGVILHGVSTTDQVRLTCNAEFEDADAGEGKTVILSDFALTGHNSDKYELQLPGESDVFQTTGTINAAEIEVVPNGYYYKGEELPKEIPYYLTINGQKLNSDLLPEIKLYIKKDDDDKLYYDIDSSSVTGNNYIFTINSTSDPHEETPTAPVITSAVVSLIPNDEEDKDGKIAQYDFGIASNRNVCVKVTAESVHKIPVTIGLSDSQKQRISVPDGTRVNDKGETVYIYTAEFTEAIAAGKAERILELNCSGDNGQKEIVPIPMSIPGTNDTTSKLILDSKKPVVSGMNITYDDQDRSFTAKGYIKDNASGINKIKYEWDTQGEKDYAFEKDGIVLSVYFSSKVMYRDSQSVPQGLHTLHLDITDNAGNHYTESGKYCSSDQGPDSQAPDINTIVLKTDDGSEVENALTFTSRANYCNKPLTITMNIEDVSESERIRGVQKVSLIDKSNNDHVISSLNGNKSGEYSFDLANGAVVGSLYVRVTDGNNQKDVSLSSLLKNSSCNKTPVTKPAEDEEPIIDWKNITTDKWIIDTESPEITYDYGAEKNRDGSHYYNNNGGELMISFNDDGGLASACVSKISSGEGAALGDEVVLKNEKYSSDKYSTSYTVDTSKLDTGMYIFKNTASDNAGNPETESSAMIFVDHEVPKGDFSVVSHEVTEIDGQNWIIEKDENNAVKPVVLRLNYKLEGSDLYKIHFKVNGKEYTADTYETDEEGNTYADIKIDPSKDRYDDYNEYFISADIEALSGNTGHAYYTLHMDTEAPVIDRFTIEKKFSIKEAILNVLPFGSFSNDSVRLSVDVHDGEHDSGVDYVTITHDGIETPLKMVPLGENRFVYDLDIDTKVFQSDIIVNVYDKVGKHSISCPNIENTEREKGVSDNHFVMLEDHQPALIVDLPEPDSVQKDNGRIWYRKHTNSDKDKEKLIALSLRDEDSGIRQVEMFINGKNVSSISGELEKDHKVLPDIASTMEAGKQDRTSLCGEYKFSYSIEKIAEMIPANNDGSYVIEFLVTDNAGNVKRMPVTSDGTEYKDSKVVFYRDIIEPEVEKFTFDRASSDGLSGADRNSFIVALEYGYYFKDDFEVTVDVSDAEPSSKLDRVQFRLVPYENEERLEQKVYSVPVTNGKAKIKVGAGFKGQIYARTYDNVGNVSEERTPQGFVIDKTAPDIFIEPLPGRGSGTDNNGNKLFTEEVQFRVTISDTKSGLRNVSYSKKSEKDSFDSVKTEISNTAGYNVGEILDNGWEITGADTNLVTEVSKVFTFNTDDNDISMMFSASDRSGNIRDNEESETFTIDTIAPEVTITKNASARNGRYYSGPVTYDIVVKERNFSADLMNAKISNTYTQTVPACSFKETAPSEYKATLTFPEGDYNFSFSGYDLGRHSANITADGKTNSYFSAFFNVDTTAPVVSNNFTSFGKDDDKEIFYSKDQTAKITVNEHNFDPTDMNISILRKVPGSEHSTGGSDWVSVGGGYNWKHDGDKHDLDITIAEDGVYRISMSPSDRAGNKGSFEKGSADHTTVYEIDKTPPVYKSRNGSLLNDEPKLTPFYDVYDEKRKDDLKPSVEFDDTNFKEIRVEALVYSPEYTNKKEMGEIVESPLTDRLSGRINSKKYTLDDFKKDGVYALKFTAVDKAGNESETISNTYFRMVDTDVLAYIYNSAIDTKNGPTGYYSLMSENGKALSKKATDFKDIDILVIKPKDDKKAGKLVLREDAKQYSPDDYAAFDVDTEEISETCIMEKMHLPGSYFSETFKDDGLDTRMYLSVSVRDDVYQDLASIHIDNEIPRAEIPEKFHNWANFAFTDEETITLTGITETLNDENTKVFECPRNGDRKEIPHVYDPESGTLSFTLGKGIHHIDITLEDEAGNQWHIDRVKYVRVGNFRIILGSAIGIAGIGAGVLFHFLRRRRS
ncbi:MAG TPA: YDG domain-containing protein [Ruminococcus sp.]|nr:YDG domain-containing protein [Ruminococcus sp.]